MIYDNCEFSFQFYDFCTLSSFIQDKVINEVLAMILINSTDLLRLDLDGVHVLLPYLVTALEAVLPEREIKGH